MFLQIGLAVDSRNDIYISDSKNHRICKFEKIFFEKQQPLKDVYKERSGIKQQFTVDKVILFSICVYLIFVFIKSIMAKIKNNDSLKMDSSLEDQSEFHINLEDSSSLEVINANQTNAKTNATKRNRIKKVDSGDVNLSESDGTDRSTASRGRHRRLPSSSPASSVAISVLNHRERSLTINTHREISSDTYSSPVLQPSAAAEVGSSHPDSAGGKTPTKAKARSSSRSRVPVTNSSKE